MDHQWRHRPVQGNICPSCLISHFPFCPPPPPLDQNRRFQFENDHSFHRPGFDPYRGPVGPNHANDGFGDPRYWHRNPNLGRDSHGYDMFNGVHRDGSAPMPYDHGSNGFVGVDDRNSKKMRVGEMVSGAFMNEVPFSSSRVVSEEDERRLKLIRDHGSAVSGLPQCGVGGVNSTLGTSIGINRETSAPERSFSNTGFAERGKFDDLIGGRGEISAKPLSNMEMNNFRDLGFGSGDRRGSFFHSENDVNTHNHREEHGLAFRQRYMHNDWSGHNSLPIGSPNNLEQAHQSHDAAVRHGMDWGDRYYQTLHKGDLDQQLHMPQHVPYPIPEVPKENFHTHNVQQLQPKDSIPAKEAQFSHQANWHGSSGPYHEQRSSFSTENCDPKNQLLQPYLIQHPIQMKHDFHSPSQLSDARETFDVKVPLPEGSRIPVGHHNFPLVPQYGPPNLNKQGGYLPIPGGGSIVSENLGQMQPSRVFSVQPPLPASPPPPLPVDSPGHPSSKLPKTSSSLFPIPASSSSAMVPSSYPPVPEAHSLARPYFHCKPHQPVSAGFVAEESHVIHQSSSKQYLGEGQTFRPKHFSSDKPKVIDASHLFKQPHRATRPDHIVIILRGLPGSGKSYSAKMLRDIEVENGGAAPRIHSMDDYFMTEVEKVEKSDISKSSSSVRGKKLIKVMEYCYEPEMEEAYRSSMLKAFKKTLEEGVFTLVIVDDRNLRVADFAQFWAIAKRSGYEVYILEAPYKDPAGCAARNVHGFTQEDIQKMAGQWEEAPSLYLQLDIKSLFHGDDLKESGIQEVDMDMEDEDFDEGLSEMPETKSEKIVVTSTGDHATDVLGISKDEKRWDAEADYPTERVKELGRSKWSDDLDEDDAQGMEGAKGNLNVLSGLIQAYGKEGKSVHWGDQVGKTGFSIGAAKKEKVLSLVIGPGAGYNLKSNPLPEEENPTSMQNIGESKRQGVFQERLRAERESFKAVFDRRRQRIGLDVEEE
ncbi:hypothetical protein L1049_027375 [Liquidambar formosana]|uniref:YLP motif-containing protein 1 n=1 Tax=Liquidambar formosana TaxID=63359 RepID=A0AAP0RH64_LIQFO